MTDDRDFKLGCRLSGGRCILCASPRPRTRLYVCRPCYRRWRIDSAAAVWAPGRRAVLEFGKRELYSTGRRPLEDPVPMTAENLMPVGAYYRPDRAVSQFPPAREVSKEEADQKLQELKDAGYFE